MSFFATLRPIVGGPNACVPLPGKATVWDLVGELVRRWPALRTHMLTEDDELSRQVSIYVDGRNVRWLPEGVETLLTEASEVAIFPPVAGGSINLSPGSLPSPRRTANQ